MCDFDVCECGLVFSTEVYELFTSVNEAILPKFIESLIEMFESDHRDICDRIDQTGKMDDDLKKEILNISAKYKEKYKAA